MNEIINIVYSIQINSYIITIALPYRKSITGGLYTVCLSEFVSLCICVLVSAFFAGLIIPVSIKGSAERELTAINMAYLLCSYNNTIHKTGALHKAENQKAENQKAENQKAEKE